MVREIKDILSLMAEHMRDNDKKTMASQLEKAAEAKVATKYTAEEKLVVGYAAKYVTCRYYKTGMMHEIYHALQLMAEIMKDDGDQIMGRYLHEASSDTDAIEYAVNYLIARENKRPHYKSGFPGCAENKQLK